MRFAKILAPIDFSPGSQHAMEVAARLAEASRGELVLAHAWHLPPLAFAGELPFPAGMVQDLVDDAHRSLAEATREAARLAPNARVSSRFLTGVPGDRIVHAVRDDQAFDLVVMGTHGRTGLKRVVLGSVAEYVVRHTPCSVLAVRETARTTAYQNLLVPVDFSQTSQQAVDLAARIVERGGTGITLLHVIELPVAYGGQPATSDFMADIDRLATAKLESWAGALRAKVAVPVLTRSRIGSAGGQTLSMLEDEPAFDLVVMGSHGRTGLSRVFLGSVAEKVVRHAPCPVLVARTRAH